MIRDIQKVDDYIITAKRQIKKKLYSDPDVIEVLDNPDLNPDEPDSYVGVNIMPSLLIPGAITDKQNYICFDVKRDELSKYNSYMSNINYIFMVYAHEDLIKTKYGIERHDLLAYLVKDLFNYSNFMGNQLVLISDTPGMMDSYYASRQMIFEAVTPHELNRATQTNKHEFDEVYL